MRNYLVDEYPISASPTLATIFSLNQAVFLQKLHIFTAAIGADGTPRGHFKDGRYWCYNTGEQWREVFPFWSVPTIRRIIKSLTDKKIVTSTSQYNKMKADRTKWYAIDYKVLQSAIDDHLTNSSHHLINLITPSDQIDHITSDQSDHTNTIMSIQSNNNDIHSKLIETIISRWHELFPEKPKISPRNKTIRKKLTEQLKKTDFVDLWEDAMNAATESIHLQKSTWFTLNWFCGNGKKGNEAGYIRCLQREFASFDGNYLIPENNDDAAKSFELAWQHAGRGNPQITHQETLRAVRKFGWPRLTSWDPNYKNAAKNEYVKVYNDVNK